MSVESHGHRGVAEVQLFGLPELLKLTEVREQSIKPSARVNQL